MTEENNKSIVKRKSELDFIKIIATILIVFHHYQQVLDVKFKYVNFFGGDFYFGFLVEMFFIVSGICAFKWRGSIINKRMNVVRFYFKRLLRFVPLVTLSVCLDVVVRVIYHSLNNSWCGDIVPNIKGVITTCLCIQDGWFFENPRINNPLWYISVLMWCYIVFYLITCISARIKNKIISFIPYFVIVALGIIIITFRWDAPFLNYDMARGYISFFLGVCLCGLFEIINVEKLTYQIISICAICAYVVVKILSTNFRYEYYFIVFVLWPAIIIVFKSTFMKKVYNEKILTRLAEIAFDIYIWHAVVLHVIDIVSREYNIKIMFSLTGMFISLILIVGFAIISNKFITNPVANKMKKTKLLT